jgi:hypothetical protein
MQNGSAKKHSAAEPQPKERQTKRQRKRKNDYEDEDEASTLHAGVRTYLPD